MSRLFGTCNEHTIEIAIRLSTMTNIGKSIDIFFSDEKANMSQLIRTCTVRTSRAPDKSAYWKTIFLISHPKHMLWVLKRTILMRRVF